MLELTFSNDRLVAALIGLCAAACSVSGEATPTTELSTPATELSAPAPSSTKMEPEVERVDIHAARSPLVCTPTYINVPNLDQAILTPDNLVETFQHRGEHLQSRDDVSVLIAEVLERTTTTAGIDELSENATQIDRAVLANMRTIAYRTRERIAGPDLGETFTGFVRVDSGALTFTACGDRPPEAGTLELLSVAPRAIAETTVPDVMWRLGLDRGRFNAWVPLNDWNPDRLAEVHELPADAAIEALRHGRDD